MNKDEAGIFLIISYETVAVAVATPVVDVAAFSSTIKTFSGCINVPSPKFVSSVVRLRNERIGPKLASCLLLTGPRPGIKNLHSIVVGRESGTRSCSITFLASAKVFDFRDFNFTKPTFLPGPPLELGTSTVDPSMGRLCFMSSFIKSSPSSDNSTMGLAHSFFVVVIASKAEFKFLRIETCAIDESSFNRGKPRGRNLGRDFGLDDDECDLFDEDRFTGETSLLCRFLDGGTFFV